MKKLTLALIALFSMSVAFANEEAKKEDGTHTDAAATETHAGDTTKTETTKSTTTEVKTKKGGKKAAAHGKKDADAHSTTKQEEGKKDAHHE